MNHEFAIRLMGHIVCIVQWSAFAMVHWACLGRGRLRHPLRWTAGAQVCMFILSIWVNFGFFNRAAIFWNIVYLLVTSLLFGGTLRQKLWSCLINGMMCLLVENAVMYLYVLATGVQPQDVWRYPSGVFCFTVAMLLAGAGTAHLVRKWGKKQVLEPLQMLVTGFFPGVVVVLNILLMVSGGKFDAARFSVLFTVGLTVAVMVHLVLVQMLNEQVVQRKDSQYRAALEQERAEALMDSYTEQRRLTHEFTNHTEALSLMLQQGDVEGAKAYLAKIDKNIQSKTSILNTHNPLLDALLSKKYEEASQKGVMMYFDLSDLREIPLEPTDLVIVVANLLNNAIEAAEHADPPEVHVRFRRTETEFLLSVRNRVQKDLELEDGQLPRSSKKEPGHGMGLENVREVLERCGAEYTLSCRDRWFRFTCSVPICKL